MEKLKTTRSAATSDCRNFGSPTSPIYPMRTAFLILLLSSSLAANAQYEDNPLKDRRWLNLSNGMSTADHLSWQSMLSYSRRGETMLTLLRAGYSQELIEGANDSIFYRKNRLAEVGMMWGDGWAGRSWYVAGGIGMGLNLRMYGDSALQDENSFRYLTAVTIGVPAQVEAGVLFNDNWGVNLTLLGNWNFREPYAAGHLGVIYRFRKTKS